MRHDGEAGENFTVISVNIDVVFLSHTNRSFSPRFKEQINQRLEESKAKAGGA